MCRRHTVVAEQEIDVVSPTTGGVSTTNPTGGTSLQCWVEEYAGEEIVTFDQKRIFTTHRVFFATKPPIDERWSLVYQGTRRLFVAAIRNPNIGIANKQYWTALCYEGTQGSKV